ncbi:fungal-specific transcription factor domain-containing protein [Jimgerdemannia flammicorona]|uniref:Fungal-specific transcription factor domain-containing protein n=1 Tax=Jimgerdemannia flammicorona TaxID=994334 RepID=A0A433A2T2_9FUNG|nr:fungal-specific transcription factor domain-containing protein [Jimgerdemannia flammicorona]
MDQDYANPKLSTVQALLLLGSQQNLFSEANLVWLKSGMAIRLAQDLGLHRSSSKWRISGRENRIRRRIWWATYITDRWTGATLGRPLAIFDGDCDVELPSDYDSDDDDDEEAKQADIEAIKQQAKTKAVEPLAPDDDGSRTRRGSSTTSSNSSDGRTKSTCLFTQLVRLSQIMGHILNSLYTPKATSFGFGVDMATTSKELTEKLHQWRNQLPEELMFDPKDLEGKEKLKPLVGRWFGKIGMASVGWGYVMEVLATYFTH